MNTYLSTIKLKHNQIPHTNLNLETGEISPIVIRPNNIPEGKSRLNYKEFAIINTIV